MEGVIHPVIVDKIGVEMEELPLTKSLAAIRG
jgi:hypothetical protein